MTNSFFSKFQTMPYTHRLATPADAKAIAPLMSAFAQEREAVDPSMTIEPNYDFEKYVSYQLEKPLAFCWVLDKNGSLKTSEGLPIYPTPVRDPQKNDWVFNAAGELVVCPVLRDENDRIVEHEGIPQFCPPAYEAIAGKISLQRNAKGNCVFCEVERGKDGKIVRSPDGMPVFKQPLLV